MATVCRVTPDIGVGVFQHFNHKYGYKNAAILWNAIANNKFQEKYKDTLVYDGEGFPTLESIMKCDEITNVLNNMDIAKNHSNEFTQNLDATVENAQKLMEEIREFNKKHDDFIALLSSNNDRTKLKVEVVGNTNNAEAHAGIQNSIMHITDHFFNELNAAIPGATFTPDSLGDTAIPNSSMDNDRHAALMKFVNDVMLIARSSSKPQVDLAYNEAKALLGAMAGSENTRRVLEALGQAGFANPQYSMPMLFMAYMNGDTDNVNYHVIEDMPIIKRTFDNIIASLQKIDDAHMTELSNIKSMAEEAMIEQKDDTNPFYNIHQEAFEKFGARIDELKETMLEISSITHKLMTLTQNTSTGGNTDEEGNLITERSMLYKRNVRERERIGNIQSIEDLIRNVFDSTNMVVNEVNHAVSQLKNLASLDVADRFKVLRNLQMTIQALDKQSEIINTILEDDDVKKIIQYKSDELKGTAQDGLLDKVYDAKRLMNDTLGNMQSKLYDAAKESFIEYVKPFVGETIVEFDEHGGRHEVPIAEMFNNIKDIGMWNRWLTCMSDNPATIMQIFNKIVDDAKAEKRLEVIERCREIRALGFEAEKIGITSFDKFFESDKANYVMPKGLMDDNGYNMSYDQSAYNAEYEEELKRIDEKYGNGNLSERMAEITKWQNEHRVMRIVNGKKTIIPNPSIYPSAAEKFSDEENAWYDKWLKKKAELEMMLGEDSQELYGTIKISKSMLDSLSEDGLENTLANMKESLRNKVQRAFDEDTNDGARNEKTLDFNNQEIMHLGTQYQNCPKSKLPLLSTDMIGTLQAYTEMACNHKAMEDVVNPLEIGKSVLNSNRTKILSNSPGKEILKYGKEKETRDLSVDNPASALIGRLNDFMASEVYGRFMNDNGDIKVLGAKVDTNKAVGTLLKLGSACQLGFNALSWFANVATGASMQRIEAIAGQYFKYKDLAGADKEFGTNLPDFMADLTRRGKRNKITLIDELFDVRMDEGGKKRHADFYKRNFLGKFFGPNIQFIGQDAGDAWMYNRTALAVLKREKAVNAAGEEKSIYDLISTEWVNPDNHDEGKKLVFEEGYTYKGNAVGSDAFVKSLSKRMKYINHHLFGVYDEDSQIAARRTLVGRMVMQYRDWLPAQLQYRYGKRTHNIDLDEDVEGYYRTGYNFMNTLRHEWKNGSFNIAASWNTLEDWEKRNIYKCLTEMGTYFTLAAIATFFGKSNPEDKTWARKTLRYMAMREKTEHAILTPASGLSFAREVNNIIKSPMACTSTLERMEGLAEAMWVPNWFQEVESGTYKGHSEGYKALMRSPVSVWYNTIRKELDPSQAAKAFK